MIGSMRLARLAGSQTATNATALKTTGTATKTIGSRAATPNRQLQFLTPGGTRIIWVFNQDLDLKASLR